MSRWLLLAGTAVLALGVTVAEIWRRDPERQMRMTLTSIEAAFLAKDAAGVMAEIHRDYPVSALWPDLFAGREPAQARDEARRLLAVLFLQHRDQAISCVITVRSLTVDGQTGSVVADVAVDGGVFGRAVPMLTAFHLRLARTSWLTGAWGVVGHDVVPVQVGG